MMEVEVYIFILTCKIMILHFLMLIDELLILHFLILLFYIDRMLLEKRASFSFTSRGVSDAPSGVVNFRRKGRLVVQGKMMMAEEDW